MYFEETVLWLVAILCRPGTPPWRICRPTRSYVEGASEVLFTGLPLLFHIITGTGVVPVYVIADQLLIYCLHSLADDPATAEAR